jgi:molybdopterin/thiamine biosynthesis adenylyltransferase
MLIRLSKLTHGRAMNRSQREKYSRQIRFGEIGEAGQERLLSTSAVIVGCGALGTVAANLLVRAGVGRIRIIDRDFVEASNLQRQTLFEEADAVEALPKAVAAERRLRAINSEVTVEGMVGDLTADNALEFLTGFAVILDGTNNFETRLLLNDAAVSIGIPWIYAAAVGSYGVTMTVRPQVSACLACLLEDSENRAGLGAEDTCDTVGVLNAAAGVIASLEAAEAMKLLLGRPEALSGRLISCDVWTGKFQSIRVPKNPACRACALRKFIYLDGKAQPEITLCGRDSVQIHERSRKLDLDGLARRLSNGSAGTVRHNNFLLRLEVAPYEMTIFADGRAVIKGTKDPAIARALYSRYVGS